jgi:hypothetical protein
MLAQWVSRAYREGFSTARTEPLITLGSAPLEVPEFRSVVIGQLGESRLVVALDTDVAGSQAHARVLDADTRGPLRNLHGRVGTAIFFECSGGQVDKVAHLPELRFALGEPGIDTTSIDNAALALEGKAFFIRRVGTDGFQLRHQPTLKKVVNDRRASLDENNDIRPVIRNLVQREFDRGASIPIVYFPSDGAEVQDSPRLTLVIADPQWEWAGANHVREQVAEWTMRRGQSHRLYPGALVWCIRKPGRELRDKAELLLAWRRVQREVSEGTLGSDFSSADLSGIRGEVGAAEEAAKDEVWAVYRYVVIADNNEPDSLEVIDLGAGHASSAETLCGRVIAALKSEALLNESVGTGYIERNWPPALKASGAWPLSSLRQSFLNGSPTRLLDPDKVLRAKIVEFVGAGDFGLGSGQKPDGAYERVWLEEPIGPEEVAFEAGVYLLKQDRARALKTGVAPQPEPEAQPALSAEPAVTSGSGAGLIIPTPPPPMQSRTLRLVGTVPPEAWNRFGTRVLPKLRAGDDLRVEVDFSLTVRPHLASSLASELRQILDDLGLADRLRVE